MKTFWAKVNKDGPIPSHMPHLGQCWIFGRNAHYGTFKRKGESAAAHRVSWELTSGPIPKGKMVLHHCDNPPCVNPDHLFIGTAKDNMEDALRKGRRPKTHKTSLLPLLPLTPGNTLLNVLKKRINESGKTPLFWSRELKIANPVLWRWLNNERSVSLGGIRALARYFVNDGEMLKAISNYALGFGE